MFDLRTYLGLGLLDLAPGLVQRTAFAQMLVGAASRSDLPDHLPTVVLRPFLYAGVTGVSTDNVLATVQQMGNFRHVSHVGGCAMDMMYQARFCVGSDMRFHAEEVSRPQELPP